VRLYLVKKVNFRYNPGSLKGVFWNIPGETFMLDSPIQEIKSRLDITDVIKDYVNLEKAGSNYRALCPFHSERSPSFFVNPARQIWRCFGGCNEGGDMFQFVMRVEGVEFGDALRILAKKAGVELKKQNKEVETERKRLHDICEEATLFFQRQLRESKRGKEAQEYLEERGIDKETAENWRVGYAPTAKDSLSKYLIGQGYGKEEISRAGVAIFKNNLYDRFRARIMFPIFNLSGYPVGFGGRVFLEKDKRAKYINTPATMLYDKSVLMYGMDKAKIGIRRKRFAVIAEGYTDVILCHKAGYDNVVSSSGTALTAKQLDVLWRYTGKMLTAFDMDEAGNSATEKGIELAMEKGFEVRVIMMPKDTDPADVVKEDAKKWEEYVQSAKPVMEFYFQSVLSKYDISDPHQKGKAAKELLPKIKKIDSDIERAHFVSELARKLKVSEEAIYKEMAKIKEEKREEESVSKKEEKKTKSRRELLEEKIISLCVKDKNLISKLDKEKELLKEDIDNILLHLKGEEVSLSSREKDLIDRLSFLSETEEGECEKEMERCLKEIKKEDLKEKRKKIEEEIKEAEEEGDERKSEELLKKYRDYCKELQSM